jgi:ammonium transporter, Amt family
MKRIAAVCLLMCLLVLVVMHLSARPVLGAQAEASPNAGVFLSLSALAFLLPAGFALLAAAGQPSIRAGGVALSALLAFGLSAVAYFACGFAFEFGGLGLWHAEPAYTSLNLHWSALGPAFGRGWGMLGLSGFFLSGGAAGPAVLRLFLAQLPLVTTATMLPLLALRRHGPALLGGLLMALVCYPLLGNWVWGGGWLARLGNNLGLGHGFVDLGGAGAVHLAGATVAFVGLLLFVPRRSLSRPTDAPITLPEAHLSLVGVLGTLLLPIGYWATSLSQPWPDWSTISPEVVGLNLLLAAGAGALIPGLYTWFVAGRPDAVLTARGLAAALIGLCAGSPFVDPLASLAVGAVAGALTPLLTYFVVERDARDDASGVVVMHGLGGLIGCLAPALFATGRFGQGWNGVGEESYLGVAGQGVTGLWAAVGQQPDWPGQAIAQLAGIGASIVFPGLLSLALYSGLRGIVRWRSARKDASVAGSVTRAQPMSDVASAVAEAETASAVTTETPSSCP